MTSTYMLEKFPMITFDQVVKFAKSHDCVTSVVSMSSGSICINSVDDDCLVMYPNEFDKYDTATLLNWLGY